MSLSFSEYQEKLLRLTRPVSNEATSRSSVDTTAKPLFLKRRRERRCGRSAEELSRIDWQRKQAAAERIARRLSEEEDLELTFRPKLPSASQRLAKERTPRWPPRPSPPKETNEEYCSFRPIVQRCPKWVINMAQGSRLKRSQSQRRDLENYILKLEADFQNKQATGAITGDAIIKHKAKIRALYKRGRPPSPPPSWRHS